MSLSAVSKVVDQGSEHKVASKATTSITAKEVVKRIAVVALYVLIGALHAVEMVLSGVTGNIKRAKLNAAAIKVTFGALYTYFLPKGNYYESSFDFHHLSYGLLFMLLPGKFLSFGKLITSCSLLNYDRFGGFGHNEKKHFIDDGNGGYILRADRNPDGSKVTDFTDGSLELISPIEIRDGSNVVQERAYPADGFFVRHWKTLLKEMFTPCRDAPYLDAATREKDRIIDRLVLPRVHQLSVDKSQHQPIVDIDFSLFKEWGEWSCQ